LQPLERLPAETQRHEPDEKRAARVDCGARRGGDLTRDGEAEEVETAAEDVREGIILGKGDGRDLPDRDHDQQ
jgi:hypothetical protein